VHGASLVSSNHGGGKENLLHEEARVGVCARAALFLASPATETFARIACACWRLQTRPQISAGDKPRGSGLAAILTHDFEDDDDSFGTVGRTKRNRGGVCGTPTDEDGSDRPRVARLLWAPSENALNLYFF
jgi:hypothetical protein